jgi:hypothetical protein
MEKAAIQHSVVSLAISFFIVFVRSFCCCFLILPTKVIKIVEKNERKANYFNRTGQKSLEVSEKLSCGAKSLS